MYDVIVIGGGPGGYVSAIRAGQLGLKVACVDKAASFGGTCLRVGCIPSKALLESSELYHRVVAEREEHGISCSDLAIDLEKMHQRKSEVVTTLTNGVEYLFKKYGVEGIRASASILEPTKVLVTDEEGQSRELETKKILIATGSDVATLPGIELDGSVIGSSTEALKYEQVPEHLVVIGAGAIGLELGCVWSRLGAQVTVLEYNDHILPGIDREISKHALRLLKKQGLKFQLSCRVTDASLDDSGKAVVTIDGKDPVVGDRVLVAVGRKPYTKGLGLENIGVKLDSRGFIPVDKHFATSAAGVYAIGDVIGGAMLAHKAEEEGVACVEHWVTGVGHIDHDLIPGVVYTSPEVASVGKTEEALKEAGIAYNVGTFPMTANGRARAMGMAQGLVKVLAEQETDRVLGVHIVGPMAGELIAEAATSMAFGASSEDIGMVCHAHPTLAESVKQASMAVVGQPTQV